ncbi:reverse transcriptase domain-containing protein [Serratia quinivorans]|uniref:reverse transcriptase domain-containing protein n=1 Tax=Serratia quinivorans TaxID=137545 RepID=UPI0039AEAF4E
MQVVGRQKKKVQWGARDALVLKWLTARLTPLLPVHPRCEHIRGHGGGRASVARLSQALGGGEYRYACRTDIRGYYGAINKDTVLRQVQQYVSDPVLLGLVEQFLHYTVEDGGEFHTPEKGICRGCPLSPLLGAMHLYEMDAHFASQTGIVYARYMDDFVILAKSRWQLRRHVRSLNGYFAHYGFVQHPGKTFIGRVEKGFDWLGALLGDTGVTAIAPRALANHRERVRRLYERLRHWPKGRAHARVSLYRARWNIWCGTSLFLFGGSLGASHAATTITVNSTQACQYIDISEATPKTPWDTGSTQASGISYRGQAGPAWPARIVTAAWPSPNPLPGGTKQSSNANWDTSLVRALPGCPGVVGLVSNDGHAALVSSGASDTTYTNTIAACPDAACHGGVGITMSNQMAGYAILRSDTTPQGGASVPWGWGAYPPVLSWPRAMHLYGMKALLGGQQVPFADHTGPSLGFIGGWIHTSFVWDGQPAAGSRTRYSLPAGAFLSYPGTAGAAISITVVPPPPACTTEVGGGGTSSSVNLLPVTTPVDCAGGVCTRRPVYHRGDTTFQVSCRLPPGATNPDQLSVVTPRLSFQGSTDATTGAYLLKTSQSGVFIVGTADGSLTRNGCGLWGSTGQNTSWGAIPFTDTLRWLPTAWANTTTGAGWMGATWHTAVATAVWGVCLDNNDGRTFQAGPFTATATWTLHLD